MVIEQEDYFAYAIPALMSLFAGVFIFNKDVAISQLVKGIDRKSAANLGHLLVFISFFFDILSNGVSGIRSIVSFTYPLKYAGAMCYLFAPSAVNYSLVVFIYLWLMQGALSAGIFIEFFVWSTYFFLMASLRFGLSLKWRSSLVVIAIPVLVFVQSVKQEYRKLTWGGRKETGIELITGLGVEKQAGEEDSFAESDGVVKTVGRLNQGWHLGLVLRHVPKRQDFSNGEDFLGDIIGSVLPRIFFSDKKIIGSQDKFTKYTGHKLQKTTSMTIGVLGDFYINFGWWGSFVLLFLFGALVAKLLYLFLRKYVVNDPINLIWIPYLFSYLVRANNDFYIVTNNFVKGFLIFLFVSYLRRQFWPISSTRSQLR